MNTHLVITPLIAIVKMHARNDMFKVFLKLNFCIVLYYEVSKTPGSKKNFSQRISTTSYMLMHNTKYTKFWLFAYIKF